MIEMRFVVPAGTHVPPAIPRLQYRWNWLGQDERGEWVEMWVEWRDVSIFVEPPPVATGASGAHGDGGKDGGEA